MNKNSCHEPYTLYLLNESYYSGKMESYLKYKEISFDKVYMSTRVGIEDVYRNTGLLKVPAIKTANGAWLTDSTAMIEWFENQYPRYPVIPAEPSLRFLCKLLEDYADEWCWRSAMYFRWRDPDNARYMSRRIAREVMGDWPIPTGLAAWYFKHRQRATFMYGDGFTEHTEEAISQQFFMLGDALEQILSGQPFLLGSQPKLVDFAFMGPFFRHYFCDPWPAQLLRDNYPEVTAWVTRVWAARGSQQKRGTEGAGFEDAGWAPILKEIIRDYLPYLRNNVDAWKAEREQQDCTMNGTLLKNVPVVHFRVFCLESLEREFSKLSPDQAAAVTELFRPHGELSLDSGACSGLKDHYTMPLKPRTTPLPARLKWGILSRGTPWDRIGPN